MTQLSNLTVILRAVLQISGIAFILVIEGGLWLKKRRKCGMWSALCKETHCSRLACHSLPGAHWACEDAVCDFIGNHQGFGRRAEVQVDEAKDENWDLWKCFNDCSFVYLFIQQLLTECTFCIMVGGADGIHDMRDGSQSSGSQQPVSREYSCEPYARCSRWSKKREIFWGVWESFPGEVVFELGIVILGFPGGTSGKETTYQCKGRLPHVRGKEQRLCFAGASVKKYPTSKVRETQVRR